MIPSSAGVLQASSYWTKNPPRTNETCTLAINKKRMVWKFGNSFIKYRKLSVSMWNFPGSSSTSHWESTDLPSGSSSTQALEFDQRHGTDRTKAFFRLQLEISCPVPFLDACFVAPLRTNPQVRPAKRAQSQNSHSSSVLGVFGSFIIGKQVSWKKKEAGDPWRQLWDHVYSSNSNHQPLEDQSS